VSLFAAVPLIVNAGVSNKGVPTPAHLIFFGLATLPGLIGLGNYVFSQQTRYELLKQQLEPVMKVHPRITDPDKLQPSPVAWTAGSLLLTGVFMIVAVLAQFADKQNPGVVGMVFAGYGTYVATLWFMLGRLNAHALSPRFMVNSALKAAIGILIGFIACESVAFFKPTAATSTRLLLFMVGFFHDWALGYIRKRAAEIFQTDKSDADRLPLGMIEGIDDAAADLLDELGIDSVQHLATQCPVELSMNSLYPAGRVIDWINQALLALHFRNKITAMRETGIRGIAEFLALYKQAIDVSGSNLKIQAIETMKVLAQKLGIPEGALYLMANAAWEDDVVRRLFLSWKFAEPQALRGGEPDAGGPMMLHAGEPSSVAAQEH